MIFDCGAIVWISQIPIHSEILSFDYDKGLVMDPNYRAPTINGVRRY